MKKFIPVVIYLPTVPTAYMQYVQFKYEDQKLKEVLTFFNHAQTQYLMKKSNLLGCHFIDLTSALKLAAQKYEDDILYFREHIHFTQKGNHIVAKALAPQIQYLLNGRP